MNLRSSFYISLSLNLLLLRTKIICFHKKEIQNYHHLNTPENRPITKFQNLKSIFHLGEDFIQQILNLLFLMNNHKMNN